MQCGDMKHKVDILILSTPNGPFGIEYECHKSHVYAKKEELYGVQLHQAMGEGDKNPVNFVIRRDNTVTNKMFVKCEDKMYDIKSATTLKGNENYTILTCIEIES